MSRLRKYLLWLLFGLIAFNVFNYVKMHTNGDVIAYKKYAKALMAGDRYILKNASNDALVDSLLAVQEARKSSFEDLDVVFTYYKIKDRRLSEDGKTSRIVGHQISRVNGMQQDTLWGEREIVIQQTITLTLKNSAWKVTQFTDPAVFQ